MQSVLPQLHGPLDHRAALGRIRFRRAVALMLMTLVLPGSAQLVAGRKEIGRIAMRIWFFVILVAVLVFEGRVPFEKKLWALIGVGFRLGACLVFREVLGYGIRGWGY